jgi:hypothetical protein
MRLSVPGLVGDDGAAHFAASSGHTYEAKRRHEEDAADFDCAVWTQLS